jgi:hypothetical protein
LKNSVVAPPRRKLGVERGIEPLVEPVALQHLVQALVERVTRAHSRSLAAAG